MADVKTRFTGLLPRFLTSPRAAKAVADPHLKAALAEDARSGQAIAATARSVTVGIMVVMIPLLNRDPAAIFPLLLLLGLVATDLLRRRFARRGLGGRGYNTGRYEVLLLGFDLVLLLFLTVLPNPFTSDEMPAAVTYMTGKFTVFYILIALSTLTYSWRTIMLMGAMISVTWVGAALGLAAFGHHNAELAAAMQPILESHPRLKQYIDPNAVQISKRLQEIVGLLLVTGILTLKSWRSEQLVYRQAALAGERANLSRYFSPNMVEVLARRSGDVGAVRTAEVAVLFADIVGFTKLAEPLPPARVVEILRRYYGVIETAVFDHGGTLDKYLGDGVMATFGTPEPGPHDARGAVRAARQIVAGMDALNRAEPDPAMRAEVSVGVHFGLVTLGNVGPSRRLEFAVLGDVVNVASRLETATRALGCRIVCSDAVMARGGEKDGFVPHPDLALRGREAPIDVWTFGRA